MTNFIAGQTLTAAELNGAFEGQQNLENHITYSPTMQVVAFDLTTGTAVAGFLLGADISDANTQTIAAGDLLANLGTVAAPGVGVTLTQLLDVNMGAVQGDILVRGTAWTALGAGTSGEVLFSSGTTAAPQWGGLALSLDSDVALTSPADGDRLHYHAATSKWVNGREPYVVAGFVPGTLVAGQTLLAHKFGAAVTFPANFGTTNSGETSGVEATAAATNVGTLTVGQCLAASDPTVTNNWSNIGTVVVSAGGHVGTLTTTSGGTVAFAGGDMMQVSNSGTGDATLANLMLTFAGDR